MNDIVVESGAGYQDVVDRYLHGTDVPTNTMRVTRMVLSGMPANVADRLNSECAAARR